MYMRARHVRNLLCEEQCSVMSRAVWQVSSWCGRRERHAGADSTVMMVTNGLEQRHPAEEGPPPPGRRLQLGGAGLRRRRRLHLRAGLPTLHRA